MQAINSRKIAGLALRGGKRNNFFFCLLEYYENEKRWFLSALRQVKEEEGDGNEATLFWVDEFNLKELVVDVPLGQPSCLRCQLNCPGIKACVHPEVKEIRDRIKRVLAYDASLREGNPKKYEQERLADDLFDANRNVLEEGTSEHILSRSFKRRLRKGVLPYWNRPLDFWVWGNYHDQLLKLFNYTFDSYGNASIMLLNRFSYLKRHLPPDLKVLESNTYLILVELLKSQVLEKRVLKSYHDIEGTFEMREAVIKSLEERLGLFIYGQDKETLIKEPHAFESLLLSIAGQRHVLNQFQPLPDWCGEGADHFLVPQFLLA